MNIRDLQYLVAVAKHKNFSKAASECFVSQPALSIQIQKLEEYLGCKIFERSGKKVIITEVGSEIIKKAEQILQITSDIKDIAKNNSNPFSGKVKIGAFPTLASYFLPKVTPILAQKYPDIKFYLIEEKTEILINKLQNGLIDMAFLALPIYNNALSERFLFKDEFLLAVPQNHVLANKKVIDNKDLAGNNLLLLEDGHCLRDQALEVCNFLGISEQQDFRATSLETLRQMVIASVGITLIPEIAKKNDDGLTYIKFANSLSRDIGIVWRKSNTVKDTLVLDIADIVKNLYKQN